MGGDERLLADVIDLLPLGVWIARAPGGEFVFANRTFREIMGMEARPDVAVGGYAQPYGICGLDGQPYPEHKMPFVQALQARADVIVDDIVIHRHDGGRVNIRATARPIFDRDAVTHVVIAFEDCTAEKQADDARRATERRLRESQRLESLGTLAAGVAHDFNNVLGSISLMASLLRMNERDAGRVDDLSRIVSATESAARLTHSLLAFGRQGPLRALRFDVGEVASEVVDLIKRTFDRSIEVVFTRAGFTSIVGDPTALEQVLMNLAVNARDAMTRGGRLDIHIAREGDRVILEVRDTGPGVPAELRGRIFEPYFTTKSERELPGRGLGLATVYGVVERHRGTIEVRDASPHGAIFHIDLPAGDVLAPDAPDAATPARDDSIVRGHGTVMVVDDEPMVRMTLRVVLIELGYQVVEAHDGLDALERLATGAPVGAVLLDSVMPRMSGRDTLAELRRVPAPPPVIMMGGRIVPREREELLALGAIAVLDKPFDVPRLSRLLAQSLPARS